MAVLALSSEVYPIKAADLKKARRQPADKIFPAGMVILLLDNANGNAVIGGGNLVDSAAETDFLPVRVAYYTLPAVMAFLISLIKPIKRRFYICNSESYTTTLQSILDNHLQRGERNAENAYQWTNKKWQISREEAHKRYAELYDSIKQKGYDTKQPMFVMLNRKFGIKDQILQGHHRIGICKELGVKEVNIAFWAAPKSFNFLKCFTRRGKQ